MKALPLYEVEVALVYKGKVEVRAKNASEAVAKVYEKASQDYSRIPFTMPKMYCTAEVKQ